MYVCIVVYFYKHQHCVRAFVLLVLVFVRTTMVLMLPVAVLHVLARTVPCCAAEGRRGAAGGLPESAPGLGRPQRQVDAQPAHERLLS